MLDNDGKPGRSSELRKGRLSEGYAAYSITKVVLGRKPVLAQPAIGKILLESWSFLRQDGRIKLFAFCVMPDHYHLAFCLMPGHDLSAVMEATNKFTSRLINKELGLCGEFWQEGFRDRRSRGADDLHDACIYIEANPVRAGLASRNSEWPYSSAYPQNRSLLDRDWWP